jgi:hypothetical protein
MPATGGGRAAHSQPSMRNEKAKSVETMPPPRRESAAAASSATTHHRPAKGRAISTPAVPKSEASGGPSVAAYPEEHEEEEIADDAFFQRYHFPQPGDQAHAELSPDSRDSSSDTEGPLSPTHLQTRQPSGAPRAEASSSVGCLSAPRVGSSPVANVRISLETTT